MSTPFLKSLVIVCCGLVSGSAISAPDSARVDTGSSGTSQDTAEEIGRGESGSSETSQPVFNRIELSPEGVEGTDSLGQRWYYNFNDEVFVRARDEAQVAPTRREGSEAGETAPPVEERCTELLRVDRPSLKAVYVGYDEYVDGDVVSFSHITIKGWVRGNVQSFSKRVLVTGSGQVDGDIRAPEIEVKPGGIVLGSQIQTEPLSNVPNYITTQFSVVGIWIVLGFTLALALLTFLSASLAPRQMGRIVNCLARYRARCFFLGLVLLLLLPLIITLVSITVVGIVLLPLVPFALLTALAFGMAGVARPLVHLVVPRGSDDRQSLLSQSLLAVIAYMAVWAAVAILLGSQGPSAGVYKGFGIALLVLGILATTYPFLTGLGAVVLTRFGFRDYVAWRERRGPEERPAEAPAPPPMPESPLRPGPFTPPRSTPRPPFDPLRPPSEGQ